MINPFGSVVFPMVTGLLAQASGRSKEDVYADIVAEHDARLDNPLPGGVQTMNWDDMFQTVAERYGISLDFSAEEVVTQHAAPPHTSTLDDARTVLETLRAAGERVLIVASMGLSIYQNPVMKALGLYDLFDDLLMPDLTRHLKTEREFYGAYLDMDNPRIHIGDRYDHDCSIPKSFGTKTVLRVPSKKLAVYTPWERPALLHLVADQMVRMPDNPSILPDAVITHLSELPEVVTALETR